jgi:hypothetical protein
VPSYLVETFLAGGGTRERGARERRARSAADALTRSGTRVRFEYSIHIPEDELCFFVFDASSDVDAALVAQRAGLESLRVVKAIASRNRHKTATKRTRTPAHDAEPSTRSQDGGER